jgi:hypothetical protein
MWIRIRDLFDSGSGMENSDPESGINIPDPQHCFEVRVTLYIISSLFLLPPLNIVAGGGGGGGGFQKKMRG